MVIHTYDEAVHYTTEDVELIDYVSNNISLAIERKEKDRELNEYRVNLEKKVQEKSKEILKKNAELKREIAKVKKSEKIQKVLYNISEAKSKSKNLRDLLNIIHKQVDTLMDASNFYVAIVEDKEKGLFRFPYIVDENPEEIENPHDIVDLAGGFTHYVLKTQKPLLADQKRVKDLEESSAVKQVGIMSQSWLGIPLKTPGGEILGVVAVQSYTDPHAFTRTDKDVLSIISSTIAGALKYKQLEEERNSLEEKLAESQKMEAVGILAAGVAHEFNNLLSIIIGHAYNGKRVNIGRAKDYKRYRIIEKTSERAAQLIEKLMIFAQKRERGRYFIDDIAKAIDNAVRKARQSAPAGCHISIKIKEKLWPVKIDKEGIDDVLSNILDNALHAVDGSDKGFIKVSAENFKGRPLHSPLKEAYKHIYIKIEDNGCGMDEATRAKIFNPFFTTREPGQGTGMGLSIVYTIIKEYYGSIDVESEKGKGTVFHIFLPTTSFFS
jgi:signal transduction histidine kinase